MTARLGIRSVVARGLASDDPAARQAAVDIAVDEGVRAYAADLARYVSVPGADPAVVARIRAAAEGLTPDPSDPWVSTLAGWARPAAPPSAPSALRVEPLPATDRPAAAARRVWAATGRLVDAAVLGVLTFVIGVAAGAFTGFPKGADAWGHLSKVQLLLWDAPNVAWNRAWYSGMPYFQGSYPPLYHALVAGLVSVADVSIPDAMVAVAAGAGVVIVVGTYGLVETVTGRRLPALAAGLLVVASPALWSRVLEAGLYPRFVGLAYMALGAWAAAAYARKGSGWRLAVAAACTAGAVATHIFVGAVAVAVATAVVWAVSPRPVAWRRTAAIVAAVGGLTAFFSLPFLLVSRGAGGLLSSDFAPLPFDALVRPGARHSSSLPPALLALVAALGLGAWWAGRRVRSPHRLRVRSWSHGAPSRFARRRALRHPLGEVRLHNSAAGRRRAEMGPAVRLALLLGAGAAVLVVYATLGHVWEDQPYLDWLDPLDSLVYVTWSLAVAAGLLAGGLARVLRPPAGTAVAAGALVVAVLMVVVAVPGLDGRARDYDTPAKREILDLLPAEADSLDHRIAAPVDTVTDALNSRVPTPQVRGYQVEGRLYATWQAWIDLALAAPFVRSPEERRFLLDWYGVRWLYAGPGEQRIAPYRAEPDRYTLLDEGASFATFAYAGATSILAATATPTVLVIGDDSNYELVMRALAPSVTDSRTLVPVRGGRHVDDHTLDELRRFDAVLLYGWAVHDRGAADRLLADYVRGGGALVVEAADQLAFDAGGEEEPWPVRRVVRRIVQGSWSFATSPDVLTEDLDLDAFAPPVFGGDAPWEVFVSGIPAPWATPVVTVRGEPVVMAGTIGDGRVVWSGLNLPFHAASYENAEESRFLAAMVLTAVAGGGGGPAADPEAEPAPEAEAEAETFAVDGEHRVAVVHAGDGVLLRESAHDNWHATVDGRPVRVYHAGPDFMYVPLGPRADGPQVVVFDYRESRVEHVGRSVTVLSAVLLAGAAVIPPLVRRARRRAGRTAS